MGLDGFIWWIGVVESREDPLKLGRAQVRIYNWHTADKVLIPSEHLPWAHPVLPLNNNSPIPPKEGEWIMGFFLDGASGQYPVMMGTLPGIPEVTPPRETGFSDQRTAEELAVAPRPPAAKTYYSDGRGVVIEEATTTQRFPDVLNQPSTPPAARNADLITSNSFVEERRKNRVSDISTADPETTWSEPESEYDAVYPFNKVTETESGHLIEIDDTFGHERIQVAHRSGTFVEYYPDGSKVVKVVKNNYEIVMADDNVYIMGACNVTINGKARLYIKGDYDVKVGGNLEYTVAGDMTTNVSGETTLNSDGNFRVEASRIDLNE